jgi:hypothetical protein
MLRAVPLYRRDLADVHAARFENWITAAIPRRLA